MKTNLLFALLLSLSIQANAQVDYTPFDFETSTWSETYYALWFTREFSDVYAVGDTLIDNVAYHKLWRSGIVHSYDDPWQVEPSDSTYIDNYVGAMRENNLKQIEFIDPYQEEPQILYDFNMELGDTLNLLGGDDPQYDAFVTAIDTVGYCGTLRNRYHLMFVNEAIDYPQIIEGVGSSAGIIPRYELFESGGDLLCYSNNTCECSEPIISNTNTLANNNLPTQLFPNPAANEFVLASEAKAPQFNLSIYNLYGEQIYKQEVNQTKVKIDCSSWANGTYMLLLEKDDWRQLHRLVVVNP